MQDVPSGEAPPVHYRGGATEDDLIHGSNKSEHKIFTRKLFFIWNLNLYPIYSRYLIPRNLETKLKLFSNRWKFPKSDDFQEMAGGPTLSGRILAKSLLPEPKTSFKCSLGTLVFGTKFSFSKKKITFFFFSLV